MKPSIRPSAVAAPRAVPCALALALLLAAPAYAIGPEAPVDFVDHYVREGFVAMVIEPERLASLDVSRAIYSDGTPLSREPDPVPWRKLRMSAGDLLIHAGIWLKTGALTSSSSSLPS